MQKIIVIVLLAALFVLLAVKMNVHPVKNAINDAGGNVIRIAEDLP